MATKATTKTKKGKRASTDRKSQLKRVKAAALVRAKRAKAKQPKRAAVRPSTGPPRARRRSDAAKSASELGFQRRRVVVRFHDGFNEERERKELTELYGRIAFHPVFIFARSAVERLQAVARERNSDNSLPNLLNYYFVYLQPGRKPAQVVHELRKRDRVAFAYEDEPTENANSSTLKMKCGQSSGHIDGGGVGVDARSAWAVPGGKGEGQFFVDVENGWTEDHIRLPTSIERLVGESQFWESDHGTSVLGIVCGKHEPGGGCEGLAPNVKYAGLASPVPDPAAPASLPAWLQYVEPTAGLQNVYDAIAFAIYELFKRHGSSPKNGYGVLLIEHETAQGLPVETYEGVQTLIRLATQTLKITVVEPAGNGQANLDTHPGAQILKQQDSGAILVGSAQKNVINAPAGARHARYYWSNFGSRVNCYAWGEGVMAPAWQPEAPATKDECNDTFGNTSAAAAIIAGVALIVQGICAHRRHPPLDANQLRTILANPASGTPYVGDPIGVMPNLAKIAPAL